MHEGADRMIGWLAKVISNPTRPLMLALLAALLAFMGQTVRVVLLKNNVAELTGQLDAAKTATAVLKARITDRTAEAERQDKINIERVKTDQARITEERVNAYQDRIAALNARVDSLRKQAAAGGDKGGGRAAPMPATGTAASGTDGASGGDGFFLELRAVATAQAIRLDELQTWVREQGQVDNSGPQLNASETDLKPL